MIMVKFPWNKKRYQGQIAFTLISSRSVLFWHEQICNLIIFFYLLLNGEYLILNSEFFVVWCFVILWILIVKWWVFSSPSYNSKENFGSRANFQFLVFGDFTGFEMIGNRKSQNWRGIYLYISLKWRIFVRCETAHSQ